MNKKKYSPPTIQSKGPHNYPKETLDPMDMTVRELVTEVRALRDVMDRVSNHCVEIEVMGINKILRTPHICIILKGTTTSDGPINLAVGDVLRVSFKSATVI